MAQIKVITLKTQLHAVNARWKRLSQLSFSHTCEVCKSSVRALHILALKNDHVHALILNFFAENCECLQSLTTLPIQNMITWWKKQLWDFKVFRSKYRYEDHANYVLVLWENYKWSQNIYVELRSKWMLGQELLFQMIIRINRCKKCELMGKRS